MVNLRYSFNGNKMYFVHQSINNQNTRITFISHKI